MLDATLERGMVELRHKQILARVRQLVSIHPPLGCAALRLLACLCRLACSPKGRWIELALRRSTCSTR